LALVLGLGLLELVVELEAFVLLEGVLSFGLPARGVSDLERRSERRF